MRIQKPILALTLLLAGYAGVSAACVSVAAVAAPPAAQQKAQPMQVTDINGVSHAVPSSGGKGTVLLFVSTQCPYSNQAAPEMARIAKAYSSRGFDFVYIYGDSYESKSGIAKHAGQYGFTGSPIVLDAGEKIVQAAGATNTPEAVVLSPSGKMLYRGRIDNRFSSIGVTRRVVTQHDLTSSLDAIAAGKAPVHDFVQPVGCSIH